MEKLDPVILQRLLSGEQIDGWDTATAGNPTYSSPESGYTPASQDKTPIGFSYLDKPNKVWRVYDIDGNLVRNEPESTSSSTFKKFLTDGAMIAGGAFGLNALGGALGGTAGGLANAGAGLSGLGATPGALSLADLGLAAIPEVGAGIGSLGSGALAGGGAGLGGALGATGDAATSAAWATGSPGLGLDTLSAVGANGAGGLLSGLSSLPLQQILGGVLGAATSRDQTQTKTNAPWEPAQPFIKQQLAQGQKMAADLAANPFSQQQQTAYNNYGGLLNNINSGAQGLLAGFGANASGANNYDRSDPRRKLIGSNFDLSSFAPGLLNFFPKKG